MDTSGIECDIECVTCETMVRVEVRGSGYNVEDHLMGRRGSRIGRRIEEHRGNIEGTSRAPQTFTKRISVTLSLSNA